MAVTKKDLLAFKKNLIESRKHLMDVAEVALSEHPSWPLLRSRFLNFFGKNNLEGRLNKLIEKCEKDFDSQAQRGRS